MRPFGVRGIRDRRVKLGGTKAFLNELLYRITPPEILIPFPGAWGLRTNGQPGTYNDPDMCQITFEGMVHRLFGSVVQGIGSPGVEPLLISALDSLHPIYPPRPHNLSAFADLLAVHGHVAVMRVVTRAVSLAPEKDLGGMGVEIGNAPGRIIRRDRDGLMDPVPEDVFNPRR